MRINSSNNMFDTLLQINMDIVMNDLEQPYHDYITHEHNIWRDNSRLAQQWGRYRYIRQAFGIFVASLNRAGGHAERLRLIDCSPFHNWQLWPLGLGKMAQSDDAGRLADDVEQLHRWKVAGLRLLATLRAHKATINITGAGNSDVIRALIELACLDDEDAGPGVKASEKRAYQLAGAVSTSQDIEQVELSDCPF